MNKSKALYVGMPILSLHGEMGGIHTGTEIETGPYAVGVISGINFSECEECQVDATFEGGIGANLSLSEILDESSYVLGLSLPPGVNLLASVDHWAKYEDDATERYREVVREHLEVSTRQLVRVPAGTPVVRSKDGGSVKAFVFVGDEQVLHDSSRMEAVQAALPDELDLDLSWSAGAFTAGLGPDGAKGAWVELDIFISNAMVQ